MAKDTGIDREFRLRRAKKNDKVKLIVDRLAKSWELHDRGGSQVVSESGRTSHLNPPAGVPRGKLTREIEWWIETSDETKRDKAKQVLRDLYVQKQIMDLRERAYRGGLPKNGLLGITRTLLQSYKDKPEDFEDSLVEAQEKLDTNIAISALGGIPDKPQEFDLAKHFTETAEARETQMKLRGRMRDELSRRNTATIPETLASSILTSLRDDFRGLTEEELRGKARAIIEDVGENPRNPVWDERINRKVAYQERRATKPVENSLDKHLGKPVSELIIEEIKRRKPIYKALVDSGAFVEIEDKE